MLSLLKLLKKENVDESEIISIVDEGQEQGILDSTESQMIKNIISLDEKEAQDIMTHREGITAISAGSLLTDAVEFMLQSKNSRYPVYEGDIDNIIGILHFKDAIRAHARQENRTKTLVQIEGLLMEAKFIPETRKLDLLFRTMQQSKTHMVIVVDEYGQTAGIVSMEDILEEIVGNILDEYDEDENLIRRQGDNTIICAGLAPLSEVEKILGIKFPDENYETLNGFLTDQMGRVPKTGDDFELLYEGWRFKVAYVKGRVIQSVRCTKEA